MADQVYGFSADGVARIAQTVRAVQGTPGDMRGAPNPGRTSTPDVIWVKIGAFTTVSSTNRYAWTEARPLLTGFDDITGGQAGTTTAGYALHDEETMKLGGPIPSGQYVRLRSEWAFDSSASNWVLVRRFSCAKTTIAVTLTKSSGSDGTATTAPTYKYAPKDETGAAIKDASGTALTDLVPSHNRPIGSTMVGTRGTLWRHADGTYELYQTDEAVVRSKRSC